MHHSETSPPLDPRSAQAARDLADAFSDSIRADSWTRRDHRSCTILVATWLADHDLDGRWDRIDFADLGGSIRGSHRERGLFWITLTGVLVFMGQTELLPASRVRQYLDTIVEVAPADPAILSLLCAGQAALTDVIVH